MTQYNILDSKLARQIEALVNKSSIKLVIYDTDDLIGWAGPKGEIENVRALAESVLAECDRLEKEEARR